MHLQTEREIVTHPGAKGATAETNWKAMLDDHLPSRNQVSKAFVIDSGGGLSEEIDLVIHDRQYSPLLFNRDGALYVPAESVYAVLEVKQEVDKGTVEYAGKKAASVVRSRGRAYPCLTLVATSSRGSPSRSSRVSSRSKARGSLPLVIRSLICCGDRLRTHGFSFSARCVMAAVRSSTREDGTVAAQTSATDTGLVFFFLRLLGRLQSLGTVPAIDLTAYGKSLES